MAAMRRKLRRFESPGHVRYLTESCHGRLPLFGNDGIKDAFATHLERVRRRMNFELYAWVIMPEHVHLLLTPGLPAETITDVLGPEAALCGPGAGPLAPLGCGHPGARS
jgi:REP element-mobilizing transposase RayT